MKLNTLLTISSVYMALVGLGLIFFPRAFGQGVIPADTSPALICYLRLWGSPLFGIAILDWMARKVPLSKVLHAIITGNAVGFAAIAALDAWACLMKRDPQPEYLLLYTCFLLFPLF